MTKEKYLEINPKLGFHMKSDQKPLLLSEIEIVDILDPNIDHGKVTLKIILLSGEIVYCDVFWVDTNLKTYPVIGFFRKLRSFLCKSREEKEADVVITGKGVRYQTDSARLAFRKFSISVGKERQRINKLIKESKNVNN